MFNDDDAKKAFKTQVENERRESSVKEHGSSSEVENTRRENRKEAYRVQQERDLLSEGLPVREALNSIKSEVTSRLHRRSELGQKLPFPGSRTTTRIAQSAGRRVKSGLKDFGSDVKRGFNGYSVGRKINQTIVEGIKNPFDEEDRRPRISVVINNAAEAPKRKRSIYSNYNTLPSPEEIMGLPRRSSAATSDRTTMMRAQRKSQRQSLGEFRVPLPDEIMGNSSHAINSFALDMAQPKQAMQTKQISPPTVAQNGQRSFHAVRGGIAEYRGGQLVKIHPRKKKQKLTVNPSRPVIDYPDPFAKFRF